GLSAGRVQSVALRLVVERERERKKFQKQAYWTIEAAYEKGAETFDAKLHAIDNKTLDKLAIATTEQANQIVADCGTGAHMVAAITKKKLTRTPPPPFTTSTLQQTANMELGFSAKQTMMLAQKLYEGIELGDEGSVGLITYMRTDSVNLSQKFVEEARTFVSETHSATYCAPSPRTYATKSKGAQEAHEAIRPTSAARTPASIESYCEPRMWRLYNLIWRRAVATQMADATVESTGVTLTIKNYTFRSAGSVIVFDGFLKIAGRPAKEKILPALTEGETYTPKTLAPLEHSTEPPARYSDATLVKSLEEYGIGRPSTYAPTIATIIDRNYVRRDEKKRLEPTDIAFVVNDLLVEHFPNIVDYQFTANVEGELDAIAEGKLAWQEVLALFYRPFHEQVQKKMDEISKKAVTEQVTDEICEKCQKPMVIKIGRFGKFLACTGFPECRNTKAITADGKIEALPTTDEKCPTCGSNMIVKEGRFGRFIACANYPKCKTTKAILTSIGIPCPICTAGEIVARRSKRGRTFYGCNRYPECKAVFWSKPTGEKCPICKSLMVAGKADTVVCSNKECKGGISNS
ncbi:type I DNA topoisomerase, partial [Candidatus Uhrbacteria bacterium]|nr:type I DNA topoisomerase [Candidatus Uhrbacteria bacterium]